MKIDEIEKFFKKFAGKCFPEKLKIYAPTCYGKCIDAVEELNSKVLETFGGSTVYDAEGCWISEETGETECEPVKVIEVGHHCTDRETAKKLIQAIKDYAVKAKQYSVAVSQGSFYIAETEELVKAFEKQFSK